MDSIKVKDRASMQYNSAILHLTPAKKAFIFSYIFKIKSVNRLN